MPGRPAGAVRGVVSAGCELVAGVLVQLVGGQIAVVGKLVILKLVVLKLVVLKLVVGEVVVASICKVAGQIAVFRLETGLVTATVSAPSEHPALLTPDPPRTGPEPH